MTKAPNAKAIKNFFKLISLELVEKVKAEIARGMDPNVQSDPWQSGSTMSALMYALQRNYPKSARVLLDAGANVKATGKNGDTALHHVTSAAFAKELLAGGADVNAKTKRGETPLHAAAEAKNLELVELLIESGARIEAQTTDKKTPYALSLSAQVRALLKQRGAKGFSRGGGIVLKPKVSSAKATDVDVDGGAIGVDQDGRVWFGGNEGLFVLEGDKLTRYVFEESFSVAQIAGAKGTTFFATNWGLLQQQGGKFTLFQSDNSELFDNHVTYMAVSPDGHPHLVHYEDEAEEKHISVFDGETFTVLSPGEDFPKKVEIKCLAFDANGRLIIGADDGVLRQDAPGQWSRTKIDSVYDIAVAGDTLFVGAMSGVFELGRSGKPVKHATPDLASCVCKDGDVVWVGLDYGGLGRLEGTKLTIMKEESSALPDDNVEEVVRGPDGRVWVRAGATPSFVRDGELFRFDGTTPKNEKAKEQETAAKQKKRKLVPFPKKALLPASKIPKTVMQVLAKTELEGIALADLLKLVRPAIAFDVEKQKSLPVGASKFGGKPDMPASLAWPTFESDEDRALPFLLQINLANTAKMDLEGLLPKKGVLYFFSDTSPDDLSEVAVLYADGNKLVRRDFPEDLVDRKDEEDFVAQLPELAVKLYGMFTIPSVELLRARANLTDGDEKALYDLKEALIKLTHKKLASECSRLLGWPDSIQDEVVENEEQISLLQLNGMGLSPKAVHSVFEHWCSDGLIHYVIEESALRKKRFDDATAGMAYT
jgi:uncharacterized protein YwqG